MSMFLILRRRVILPIVGLAIAGCSGSTDPVDNLPRKAVTGNVSLDGQPLSQGKIEFAPAEGSQGAGGSAVGDIQDGKYSIARAVGPVPGKYKVSISSRPAIKIGAGEEPGSRPKQDPEKVPAQFNTRSTLTAEITADSTNTANFELKSK